MPQKAPPKDIREIKQKLAQLMDEVGALRDERAEINAQIREKREAAVNLGVPKRSFDAAIAYRLMDDEQRRNLDAGYRIAREAVGLPLQMDLWEPPSGDARGEPDEGVAGDEQLRRANQDGHASGLAGEYRKANPHKAGSPLFSAWDAGWLEGQKSIAPHKTKEPRS